MNLVDVRKEETSEALIAKRHQYETAVREMWAAEQALRKRQADVERTGREYTAQIIAESK